MVKKKCSLKGVVVYDNGGKSFDRYTVFIGRDVFGMSKNPLSPQGFNQYSGSLRDIPKGSHLGRRIPAKSLPEDVKRAICQRKE